MVTKRNIEQITKGINRIGKEFNAEKRRRSEQREGKTFHESLHILAFGKKYRVHVGRTGYRWGATHGDVNGVVCCAKKMNVKQVFHPVQSPGIVSYACFCRAHAIIAAQYCLFDGPILIDLVCMISFLHLA